MHTFQTITEIEEWAETQGVTLWAALRGDFIQISKIVANERGKGHGSRVMQAVSDFADQEGKKVCLTPTRDFGGSVPRLKRFYSSFGFEENKGRNKDFETRDTMVRQPKPSLELSSESNPEDAQNTPSAFRM